MKSVDTKTRDAYLSMRSARQYHDNSFKARGLGGIRYRFITHREKSVVKEILRDIPHDNVLDVPAGSGKLAYELSLLCKRVTCWDISSEMLEIAKEQYVNFNYKSVSFEVVDLANAEIDRPCPFEATVCLRLMQRVTDEQKKIMLKKISKLSNYAIVSFALNSNYQRIRRAIRRFLVGGVDAGVSTHQTRAHTEHLVKTTHKILCRRPIARGLSAEWIYLLESKVKK